MPDPRRSLLSVLEPDGSLPDLVVEGASGRDWREFLEFVRDSGRPHRLETDGVRVPLDPQSPEALIARARETSVLLSVDVEGAILNCHFWEETAIDLDLDPRQVVPENVNALETFVHGLARRLAKPILLTPEGIPNTVLFRWDP